MTKDFVMFSSGAPRYLRRCYRVEPVKCFGIVVQLDGHPGLNQALRVVNTLVSQRVVIDRHHVSRRKAAKVTRARRSSIGRHILAEPLTKIIRPHAFGVSAVPALDVDKADHRGSDHAVVSYRVQKELKRRHANPTITGHKGHSRGKCAACTGAGNGNAGNVNTELVGFRHRPEIDRIAVCDCRGEWMLRCKTVVDRYYHGFGLFRHFQTSRMLDLKISEQKSPTVEINYRSSGFDQVPGNVQPNADGGSSIGRAGPINNVN